MPVDPLILSVPETPAFVYDEAAIRRRLDLLALLRERSGAHILYSIKALPLVDLLDLLAPALDGFAASSLFEARLAAEILRGNGAPASLHLTSPGLREPEIDEISGLCSHLAFNSVEQFRRLGPRLQGRAMVGIRVNPGAAFLDDPRYDPCRPHSKLGVPVAELAAALGEDAGLAGALTGLHFHTAYESASPAPLRASLAAIEEQLGQFQDHLRWINLGGGYRLEGEAEVLELAEIVGDFRRRWGMEVFLEPGKGVVAQACHLVASVVDRFRRDGKTILVLDSGVHHLPEVFEYQRPPAVAGHRPEGAFFCLLAGCSCLPGDVFGEYRFDAPLEVGDRVVFRNVGAYSLVKASRFNGFDLPAVYALGHGRLRPVKRFGYEDYRGFWTGQAEPLAAGTAEF